MATNKIKNSNYANPNDSYSLIGGYDGNPQGTPVTLASFTFPKGKYKEFVINIFLGSYNVGNTVHLTENELLSIIKNTSHYRASIVGGWASAFVALDLSLSGNTFTATYSLNNSGVAIMRIYGSEY